MKDSYFGIFNSIQFMTDAVDIKPSLTIANTFHCDNNSFNFLEIVIKLCFSLSLEL